MRHIIPAVIMCVIALLSCASVGCSSGAADVLSAPAVERPCHESAIESGRYLWGIWGFFIDPLELTAKPVMCRELNAHYDITGMLLPPDCDDCLGININSFDPVTRILDVDVTLRNPTAITGHDVRGILFTNDFGHRLTNADAWNKLYDIPGGTLINPYKAFAKDQPSRAFPGGHVDIQNYLIYIPQPPHWNDITFAVDASWPGNCKEPYAIEKLSQTVLYNHFGASAEIRVDVYDWQDDVISVELKEADPWTDIFMGYTIILTHEGGTAWLAVIHNKDEVPPGEYEVKVVAESADSPQLLTQRYINITVTGDSTFNFEDITHPWWGVKPEDVCIDGNYAYLACGQNGLHVFNIADAGSPQWAGMVEMEGNVRGVAVDEGYAYVADDGYSIGVIAVSDPESPQVVFESAALAGGANHIDIQAGYAYVTDGAASSGGLKIINIETPASPALVGEIPTEGYAQDVSVDVNTAYVTDWEFNDTPGGLNIIDISNPGAPSIVKRVEPFGDPSGIDVVDGYAYVAPEGFFFQVVDVSPPETAWLVDTIFDVCFPRYVEIDGNHAFVTDFSYSDIVNHLNVMDISQPESVFLADAVEIMGEPGRLDISNGYAYVCDKEEGFHIVDINPIETVHETASANTYKHIEAMDIEGDYLYAAAGEYGLEIMDISDPENVDTIARIDTAGWSAVDVDAMGDYAYVATYDLEIFNVANPGEPSLINTVELSYTITDIAAGDGYVYGLDYDGRMFVIDVDPPESAYLLKTHEPFADDVNGIAIDGDYGYLAAGYSGLMIVDLSVPGSEQVVNSLDLQDLAFQVVVSNSTVYLMGVGNLHIVDANTPEAPILLKSIPISGNGGLYLYMDGGYVFVSHGAVHVIDATVPAEAFEVGAFEANIPGEVVASGGYVYFTIPRSLRVGRL